ncbi:hypothetical protein VNI00_009556 [Paramarasmius palmivorus]|uniref:Uncharacterized protein n=1 Tax=Paramarasmius palmivorus TaxID=297713 RepID=A0AAW0CPM8_9AGAR
MSKRPNPYSSSTPPTQRQRLQSTGGQAAPAREREQTYTVTTKPTKALPPKPTPAIQAPQSPAIMPPQHHLAQLQPIPSAPPPYFSFSYPYPAWLLQYSIQHQVKVESMFFSVLHGRGCSLASVQTMPPERLFPLFKEVWDYIEQYLNALPVPPQFLPQVPPIGSALAPPDNSTQVKEDPGGDDLPLSPHLNRWGSWKPNGRRVDD